MLDKDTLFYSTMDLIGRKGTKFTMDEVARNLGISKRTLYENILSKEALSIFMVTHYFEIVEDRQRPIREDASLDPVEKLRRLLTTTPNMPLLRFGSATLRTEFPKAYMLLDEKLTLGWENTFRVMDEGIAQGKLRDFDKLMFARVYASGIEGLISEYGLSSGMTFNEMQRRFVDLLLFGITA
jgi:AcrR family transcriptional regulator